VQTIVTCEFAQNTSIGNHQPRVHEKNLLSPVDTPLRFSTIRA
jgi:hypothetical protein